jgi:hypothetical protein
MFNIFHIVVYFCLCIIVRTNGESLATSNEEDRIVGGQPARPSNLIYIYIFFNLMKFDAFLYRQIQYLGKL